MATAEQVENSENQSVGNKWGQESSVQIRVALDSSSSGSFNFVARLGSFGDGTRGGGKSVPRKQLQPPNFESKLICTLYRDPG
jgi:hypothetical protein